MAQNYSSLFLIATTRLRKHLVEYRLKLFITQYLITMYLFARFAASPGTWHMSACYMLRALKLQCI